MRTGLTRLGILGSSLIVLCTVLAAVIWLQLSRSTSAVYAEEQAGDAIPSSTAPQLPSVAINFPPLQQYAEIVERPLFDASRRPAPPEAKETSVVAKDLRQLTLTGVVMTPAKNLAILNDKNPSDIIRLEKGMAVDGWSLDEIRADGITFRKGDTTHELPLYQEKDQTPVAHTLPPRRNRRFTQPK